VELFFKWMKQNLRIKGFYGTSENAVRTQIWIAISIYVLVAIIKKQLNLEVALHTLLQILSVTLFEKPPLQQAVADITPVTNDEVRKLNRTTPARASQRRSDGVRPRSEPTGYPPATAARLS
jgi:hypothetical protein